MPLERVGSHLRTASAPGASARRRLGTSEMARLIREHGWAQTPLGPIEEWPETLLAQLETILHSSFQLALYWGPDLVLLYNDAERAPLGELHPGALGQPARVVLADFWDEVGPMLEGVIASGRPTWAEDAPLVFSRGSAPEEAFFTWSYSPVFGESGCAEGVLLVSVETTRRVLSERRLRTLHALGAEIRGVRSAEETWRRGVRALVGDPDIVLAEVYVVDGEEAVRVASACGPALASVPEAIADLVRTGEQQLLHVRLEGVAREPCPLFVVPLRSSSSFSQSPVLVVAVNPLRRLDPGQQEYVQLLAGQLSAGALDVAAFDRERARARSEAIVEERHRIERDLHDSIQRQLVGARLVTELTRELTASDPAGADRLLDGLSEQLAAALAELREIIAGHYPSLLRTEGVAAAVRAAAEQAQLIVAIDGELPRLEESREQALYYTVVEAVQNAFKHGGSGQRVGVRFRTRGTRAVVLVHDDGVGFDRDVILEGRGLRNMRERLESIGGVLRVRSSPGRGTWVRCTCALVPDS
jgi:signal transduction histidine kinase